MILNTKLKNLIPCIIQKNSLIITTINFLQLNLLFLKKNINYQLTSLQTIIGIDYISNSTRFSLIYQLYSYTNKQHMFIKIFFSIKKKIPSITKIFINANWFEREIWDMFGIFFTKHPDLRRILTDYTFEGHPLRKDFPLTGFVETNFLEQKGGLFLQKLSLSQKPKF